ncbi:MAG: TRAP transporter small permease, partial [Alphaproteobacteria bacterium]
FWVCVGILGRFFDFYVRGTDAYAGYAMAACSFLALAHTLKKGEHIRVELILQKVGPKFRRALQLWSYFVATLLAALFAIYSVKLAVQSYSFDDISTANDATPLWIPQIAMAAGTIVLFIAFVDELVLELRGRRPSPKPADTTPAHYE